MRIGEAEKIDATGLLILDFYPGPFGNIGINEL